MDPEKVLELQKDGIRGLFEACNEYHQKHSKGPGGAAICICGAAGGGSRACSGLASIVNLFTYANWGDPRWKERYEFLQEQFFNKGH